MPTISATTKTTGTTTTGAASTAAAAKTGTTKQTLAGNFDQFLTLLTTQLKNQNPLDPLNTNDFTNQLVQFASVEQQIKSNDTLTSLLSATKASTATNALAFVGMSVTADGTSTTLSGGKASWVLSAPRNAAQATVTIKNDKGEAVYTENRGLAAGDQPFTWNGRSNAGTPVLDGQYSISVIAQDSTGAAMTVSTQISGTVDSVDLSGTTPALRIGNATVPIDKVKTMRRPLGA